MVVCDRASVPQITELTSYVVPALPVWLVLTIPEFGHIIPSSIFVQTNYLTGKLYLLIGTSNSAFGSTRVDTSRRAQL
jgi:hypothetical protein